MGDIEQGVDVIDQGMPSVDHSVRIDPPTLVGQGVATLAVTELQHGMGGEAGAQGRGDMPEGPVDDLDQGLPEGLVRQIGMAHVGTGDDERVQPFRPDAIEIPVITVDVRLGRGGPLQLPEGEGIDIELGDLIALVDEAQELPLRGGQDRIRHHVQEPDVQLADILLQRLVRFQDRLALSAQMLERREIGIGDDRHVRPPGGR